jgi:hypothetical protein
MFYYTPYISELHAKYVRAPGLSRAPKRALPEGLRNSVRGLPLGGLVVYPHFLPATFSKSIRDHIGIHRFAKKNFERNFGKLFIFRV